MIVVGGVYREVCEMPRADTIFGSAGRAAVALASVCDAVQLHAYCPDALQDDVRASLEGSGLTATLYANQAQITFRYLHPMARPVFAPDPTRSERPIEVTGKAILRFGMMETEAVVTAERAVYDPQSSSAQFRQNGSTATQLAIVLNSKELAARTPTAGTEIESVAELTANECADIIIVKAGAVGANVYQQGALLGTVPPYRTERVFKIGSGDMFTAGFTHAWLNLEMGPLEAADYASRSAAHYCETRSVQLLNPGDLSQLQPVHFTDGRQIYVAGPFFTTSDLWMVEEVCRALRDVGATPFSPYHDIGVGRPEIVAPADVEAILSSNAVLAIVSHGDPGTLFEVGYAISKGKPVIALAENNLRSDLSMLVGTGCTIVEDISTAVYLAAWASWD